MVVLGDVFAVVAFLFGVCFSAWAVMLGMAMFFPSRISSAQAVVERSPWKTLLIGLAFAGIGGFISVALLASPQPGAKLLGFIGAMLIVSVGLLGMGGLAGLIGKRIQPMEPGLSNFRALGRGAGLLVVATLLPLVGWYVFAPLILIFGAGAGVQALFRGGVARTNGAQPILDAG